MYKKPSVQDDCFPSNPSNELAVNYKSFSDLSQIFLLFRLLKLLWLYLFLLMTFDCDFWLSIFWKQEISVKSQRRGPRIGIQQLIF